MTEKRYAIVRVDRFCPSHFEEIDNLNVCAEPIRFYMNKSVNCKNCRYGDTKKQMILKVAQVIKRVTNDGYVIAYEKFGTGYINTVLKNIDVAKEIVEFLGVE